MSHHYNLVNYLRKLFSIPNTWHVLNPKKFEDVFEVCMKEVHERGLFFLSLCLFERTSDTTSNRYLVFRIRQSNKNYVKQVSKC